MRSVRRVGESDPCRTQAPKAQRRLARGTAPQLTFGPGSPIPEGFCFSAAGVAERSAMVRNTGDFFNPFRVGAGARPLPGVAPERNPGATLSQGDPIGKAKGCPPALAWIT